MCGSVESLLDLVHLLSSSAQKRVRDESMSDSHVLTSCSKSVVKVKNNNKMQRKNTVGKLHFMYTKIFASRRSINYAAGEWAVFFGTSVLAMHRFTTSSSEGFSSAAATRSLSFSCRFTASSEACVPGVT